MIATRVGWAGPHLSYIDNINYFTQTYIEVQVLLRPEVTLDQYNSGFLRVQVEGGQEVYFGKILGSAALHLWGIDIRLQFFKRKLRLKYMLKKRFK